MHLVAEACTPRCLPEGAHPARQLKIILHGGIDTGDLNQPLLLHTTRANALLHDFIRVDIHRVQGMGKEQAGAEQSSASVSCCSVAEHFRRSAFDCPRG
jgi:hypothetical protein